jgi:seryl-tRNA synthetase
LFIVVGRKDEDTTGVIGSRNSKKKNSQYIGQKKNDEDTTGVIGSRNSKKKKKEQKKKKKKKKKNQYIGKRKLTNNIVQNTVQKTKDRATRTPHETEGKIRYSGRVICSCSTCGTRRVTLGTHPVKSLE